MIVAILTLNLEQPLEQAFAFSDLDETKTLDMGDFVAKIFESDWNLILSFWLHDIHKNHSHKVVNILFNSMTSDLRQFCPS